MTQIDPPIGESPDGIRASAAHSHAIVDRRTEVETLRRIAHTLATELDLRTLLQKTTDLATQATLAAYGAFFRASRSEQGESLRLHTLSGAPREVFEPFAALGESGLFAPTLPRQGPVRFDDLLAEPGRGPAARGHIQDRLPAVRSYLAVPVISRTGELLGSLAFGHPEPGVFTERAERLAVAIAAQAAVAIENANLYEQTHQVIEDRARAEAALHESEQRLHLALEAGRMGVWEWDMTSGAVSWSPGLAKLRGRPECPFTGSLEEALADVHPEDRERVRASTQAAIREGAEYHIEYRIRTPAGEERWLESKASVFRDEAGSPRRMVGVSSDVTARKRAEHALRESEHRFARFMERLPGLAWIKDAAGRYLFANEAAEKALGTPRAGLCGRSDADILPPETAAAHRDHDLRALASGAGIESIETAEDEDGLRYSLVNKFPIPGEPGSPALLGGMAIDITDRVRAEQTRALLAAIVESSDAAIVSKTLEGVITSWNAGAERIFGYRAEEVIGRPITVLIPEDRGDEEARILSQIKHGERIEQFQTVRITKDRRLIDVSLTVSPVRDKSGAIIGVSKIARDITVARRTEAALRESEGRYRQLVHGLPAAVYTCDADGRITLFNQAAVELWGRVPELGRTLWCGSARILHPDGGEVPLDEYPMAVALRTARAARGREILIERPDGSRRNVLPHPEPLFDAGGRLIGAVNMLIDITALREAERGQRESEERFRALADNISQLAWMCDDLGQVTWYNQRWYEYTGTTWETMRGDGWKAVHHPDHVDRVVAGVIAAGGRGEVWEDTFPLRGKGGEYRWFLSRAVPIRDGQGRILRWFGTNTDITEWREAQEALRVSEARFRAMADSTPVLIWLADTEKQCTWFNRPWLEFTGRAMQEEVGQGWADGIHPDDRERCVSTYAGAFEARREFRAEYRLRRHDGVYRWVLDHGVPLFAPTGSFTGYIGSCVDVTEEVAARTALEHQQAALEQAVHERTQQLEETHRRLRVSERMASIGTLSAGLGHDMANILLPIRLHLDAAESLASGDDLLRREIGEIRASIEYLQNLSSGLRMLVVDPAERKTGTTELNTWWRQASTVLRSAVPSGIVLRSRLPETECWVRFSPTALTQVVFNLVQNAIDALRPARAGTVEIVATVEPDTVLLTVRDDGPGMTPEVRERCTQPFFTTKTRGMSTGLGLALVYGMVQEAGGTLEIESAPGRGTTVTVGLRPARPARGAPAEPEHTALVSIADPRLRAIVRAELQDLGFNVVTDPSCAASLRVVDAGSEPLEDGAVTVALETRAGGGAPALSTVTALRRKVRTAAARIVSGDSGENPLPAPSSGAAEPP